MLAVDQLVRRHAHPTFNRCAKRLVRRICSPLLLVVPAGLGLAGGQPAAAQSTQAHAAQAAAAEEDGQADAVDGSATDAEGDTNTSHRGSAAVPSLLAAPATGRLRVDGRLDEPAWQAATTARDFRQLEPREGELASETTEVRVLVGDGALHIGARLADREPAGIRARLARRDAQAESDLFEVFLDSYHDHRTAYVFGVTPAGALRDAVFGSDGTRDDSWDAVWEGKATVDSVGWTAELRIPLSQLHYSRAGDTWGVQFRRFVSRKHESDLFAFLPKSETGGVARYGHLTGLGDLPASGRLDLLPYVVSELRSGPGDALQPPEDWQGSTGFDLRYGLTDEFALTATANPDFGQVDVDPAVVNITVFETFFPERRPFFTEGIDAFRFGEVATTQTFGFPRLFHSRRIGREPHRSRDGVGGQATDVPEETSIAAAAKLSGRTRHGWSIGLLDAVTLEEQGRLLDAEGAERSLPVEPLTNYFVGRLRRELRGGDTSLGAMLTGVARDLADPGLDSLLTGRAWAGGLDLHHAWAGRLWQLDASLVGSLVQGSAPAVADLQQSSARYYQRPDAEHLQFDPTRTVLAGYGAQLGLTRTGGRHWLGSVVLQKASPGLETNDLGFMGRVDYLRGTAHATYKHDIPGRWLRDWRLDADARYAWTGDGVLGFARWSLAAQGRLANYWSLLLEGWYLPPYDDDRISHGGPLVGLEPASALKVTVGSDARRRVTFSAHAEITTDGSGFSDRLASLTLGIQPSDAIALSLEPQVQRVHQTSEFVVAVEDPLQTRTFGKRYVFSVLDQTTLSTVARLDWTFTPTLSLQVFAQPLLAAGAYSAFGELHAPRTFDFDVYGREIGAIAFDPATRVHTVDPDGEGPAPGFTFDDPAFNDRTLLGNAVLRWEYRPGSTLFLVWQQRRESSNPAADFDAGDDARALFRAPADNAFIVKATFRLGR